MSELMVTHRGIVYPWQCDHMGHMNVMWYVGKFDEASWQVVSMAGLLVRRLKKEGLGMACVEQHIDYKRELHAGTAITIRSALLEVRERWVRIIHEMRNDETGEVAATTLIVAVHIDTVTRRTRRLPEDVRERAMAMMGNRRTPKHKSGDFEVINVLATNNTPEFSLALE